MADDKLRPRNTKAKSPPSSLPSNKKHSVPSVSFQYVMIMKRNVNDI